MDRVPVLLLVVGLDRRRDRDGGRQVSKEGVVHGDQSRVAGVLFGDADREVGGLGSGVAHVHYVEVVRDS